MFCKEIIHDGLILAAVVPVPIEGLKFFTTIGEFNELEYPQELINTFVSTPELKSEDIQNQRIV